MKAAHPREANAPLFANFRQAMTWVHTWFGLTLGFVLMACFFFGTLAVFDREIDRWAIPATRFAPQPMPSFDTVLRPAYEALQARAEADAASLHSGTGAGALQAQRLWAYATHRDPVLSIGAAFAAPEAAQAQHFARASLDPRSGALLPGGALAIGSDWFYPMHYHLNWPWMNLGYWLVGLAGVVMLVALVTGVVMHRKVFREFFTFRPAKHVQRSTLDVHNMTGVLALPFHVFFAFTGVLIFAGWLYFPVSATLLQPLGERHAAQEAATALPPQRAGVAAPLASVDAMVKEARRRWAARGMPGEVGFLDLYHPGDANGYVSISRAGSDRVALLGQAIHFKASTGEVLREDPPPSAVASVHEYLSGLHLAQFRHWLLRWLYVLGGLMGCVCIATGFIFFVEKRKKQHAKSGRQGCRVVDALAVSTVTGMALAAAGMLVANRLLPETLADKGGWEKTVFWAVWALAAAHAFWRGAPVAQARISPAWREQCWALAALAVAAAALNGLTTGDHLIKTVFTHPYWPVAGVDLGLLATACLAAVAARRLGRRETRQAPAATPAGVATPTQRTEAAHG